MIIDVVKKAIHGRYGIVKRRDAMLLHNGVRVHTDGNKAFGFSLDNQQHPPFSFFKDSPPKHFAKMCDAIIVFENGLELYFALIEQKTGDSADYVKQLANGKFFCEWLVSLCNEHGYKYSGTVIYLGVLIWEPRPIPLKGSTTHTIPQAETHRLFNKFFDIQNETDIHIGQLAS